MPALLDSPYVSVSSPWRKRARGFLGALQASPDVAPPGDFGFDPVPKPMQMPVDPGPGGPSSVVGGIDYRAMGLPAIQDFWKRTNPSGDWIAAARRYWDSHPELASAGYGDWSPYTWS